MNNQNKIGFWKSTALVTGNMVGSGIFLLPASLAVFGGISFIGWIFSSLGALLLAIVFGNLSRLQPKATGGPYAYSRQELGDFPGYLVAWGYWISIWSTNAAITVALVGYLGVFFPFINNDPVYAILTGLCFIWLFTWVNTKKIGVIGSVQLITTIIKIIPIILIAFLGIFYLDFSNFKEFNISKMSDFSAITATTTLTLFAYLGMESATIPSESVSDARHTIKRATITGTSITIAIYALSSLAVMGIIPMDKLANSTSPFSDAAFLFWGESAKYIVAGGAVIATMGALNGWILIQGQIPMAAAHDKLFPRIFGKTNKNNAPVMGIIISSILVSVLIMLNYSKSLVEAFTYMMKLSTLSSLIPFIFSIASLALILLRKKEKNRALNLIITFLAFCFSIWVIIGCGQEIVFSGFILLMLGIPFYVWIKYKNESEKNDLQ